MIRNLRKLCSTHHMSQSNRKTSPEMLPDMRLS